MSDETKKLDSNKTISPTDGLMYAIAQQIKKNTTKSQDISQDVSLEPELTKEKIIEKNSSFNGILRMMKKK